MLHNPVGLAADHLVFAWKLRAAHPEARALLQDGYRIRVTASATQRSRHSAGVWDSGRVGSATFWQIPYQGPALASQHTYFWQVQVWSRTAKGSSRLSLWSAPARFTTALLKPADWSARWIAATADGLASPAALPAFRREIHLRAPVARALLFVTGLGQYELHLNGRDVTDTVLNPGWSDYRKTTYYDSYNVTRLLRPGTNVFGLLLGNGMYNVQQTPGRYSKFASSFGQPKALVQLEVRYTNGRSESFSSDASWTTHPGPIVFSSTFGGEDFRAPALPKDWDLPGFTASGWQPAVVVDGPGGTLKPEASTPLAIAEQYKPVHIAHPKPDLTVYDLGKTMSGWPDIWVQGAAGSTVRLLCGELLAADGTVTQRSAAATPSDPVLFNYTLRGDPAGERWHPRFSYYSFRYVQVTTTPAPGQSTRPKLRSMAGDFVHARVATVGHFKSSNALFNSIHTLIHRAVLSNLASILTDCPSREKLGWLEQTYLNASTLMLNDDVTRLYAKISDDIADAQLPDGLVPSIAPEYVHFVDEAGKNTPFRDSPEWGSAIILSPWALYQFTGDAQPLREHYLGMQQYAAYLATRASDNFLNYGLGDWYDIGPGAPGESQLTSRSVTATGTYYEDLVVLAHVATLLGFNDDAATYTEQAASVRAAFNTRLFHPATDQYDRGSQTANALPLALGMVPAGHEAAVLANLVSDIHQHADHVTAGDVGFHYVVRALTQTGRSDVLAAMLNRTDAPSYGYQLAQGATTLTEAWDANPADSQNHFMLGHGEEWLYRGLAGLAVDMAQAPADAILLHPSLLASVAAASASYDSTFGRIRIAWRRRGSFASVAVAVPPGAQAHLLLPKAGNWQQGVKTAAKAPGVLTAKAGPAGLLLQLGSGTFRFSTSTLADATQAEAAGHQDRPAAQLNAPAGR